MEEDALQGVIETIDSAKKYRLQLAELLESLKEAQDQIKDSSKTSREKLDVHFAELKASIVQTLDTRLQELQSQISEIEDRELQPLTQCQTMIERGVHTAMSVLNEGKQILCHGTDSSLEVMTTYKNKSNDLGLNSLPEVPSLPEVACVFVDLPAGLDEALAKGIKDYGRVMPRAPVQVAEVAGRPGALFVKWQEIEEEHGLDLSDFRLQFCAGAVTDYTDSTPVFHEAYTGPNTSHLVRHLSPNKVYTLRVCGRAEGAQGWSPWSVPHSAMTTLSHYAWRSDTEGYSSSNEDKIACSLGTHFSVLYSRGTDYTCGHSIVFKILETGSATSEDGIGLVLDCTHPESLLRKGALFITSEGKIFMDGQEKTTRLPPFRRGSVLTFDTEVLQPAKVRVTIDINEKAVTFDWTIEATNSPGIVSSVQFGTGTGLGASQSTDSLNLFFAMKFGSPEWKVAVE